MEPIAAISAFENDFPVTASGESIGERRGLAAAKKGILVIDDSPTVCAVAELALRGEGYLTHSFPDGVEAMRWLIGPGAWSPALIIVDIGLPKMDGYEVIRHLKANPRLDRTICITLSARDGTMDQMKGRLVGAQMCLIKPCTVQALCRAARALTGGPETRQR